MRMKHRIAAALAIGALAIGYRAYLHSGWKLSDHSRSLFVTENASTCKEVRKANISTHAIPAATGGDFTAVQIEKFCDCAAERDADSFTEDEWNYLGAHHTIAPSTEAKWAAISQECLTEVRRW